MRAVSDSTTGLVLGAGEGWLGSFHFVLLGTKFGSSDVCSLLTLLSLLQIEMAILRFPYESWGTPFQQLKQVVEEPSPQLPADKFSPEFVDFTSQW